MLASEKNGCYEWQEMNKKNERGTFCIISEVEELHMKYIEFDEKRPMDLVLLEGCNRL